MSNYVRVYVIYIYICIYGMSVSTWMLIESVRHFGPLTVGGLRAGAAVPVSTGQGEWGRESRMPQRNVTLKSL